MSAALQLPVCWGAGDSQVAWEEHGRTREEKPPAKAPDAGPVVSLAFYRKHTESLLRRYLYASMQVGRAPSILSDPVARGWASSRPVRTFEDAVIFVLDIEKCLGRLSLLDREMLGRVVLQEYTQVEAASMLGMGV